MLLGRGTMWLFVCHCSHHYQHMDILGKTEWEQLTFIPVVRQAVPVCCLSSKTSQEVVIKPNIVIIISSQVFSLLLNQLIRGDRSGRGENTTPCVLMTQLYEELRSSAPNNAKPWRRSLLAVVQSDQAGLVRWQTTWGRRIKYIEHHHAGSSRNCSCRLMDRPVLRMTNFSKKVNLQALEILSEIHLHRFKLGKSIGNLLQSDISLTYLWKIPWDEILYTNLPVARNLILIFLCPVNFQGMKISLDGEVIVMGQNKDGWVIFTSLTFFFFSPLSAELW